MVELIEQSKLLVDGLIETLGRAGIEAVLKLSAQGLAGAKHQGRKGNGVSWHGSRGGRVTLSQRKLRVKPAVFVPNGRRTQSKRRLIASGVEMVPDEPKFCCSIFATQV